MLIFPYMAIWLISKQYYKWLEIGLGGFAIITVSPVDN